MRFILIIISIAVFFSKCFSSGSHQSSAIIDLLKAENNHFVSSDTVPAFIKPMHSLTEKIKVVANLQVRYHSKDSVIAKLIIHNYQNETLYLYKPLLPGEMLQAEVFSFFDQNYLLSDFITLKKIGKFSTNLKDYYTVLNPELELKNFIKLASGDSLVVNCNLSDYYDFNNANKGKLQKVYVRFGALFPYVRNNGADIVEVKNANELPEYFQCLSNGTGKILGVEINY